jgi:hypothetical protein
MSFHDAVTLLVALKTVTLVVGGLITFYAYQAYRRTKSRPLGALAVGFGVITVGTLLSGVADRLFAVSLQWVLVLEAALTAVGFGVVLYSLYVE